MSGYKCHPIPTRSQGERKRERKRGGEVGEKGVAKQGGSRDSWDKARIVAGPHAVPTHPFSPASRDLGLELHLDSVSS